MLVSVAVYAEVGTMLMIYLLHPKKALFLFIIIFLITFFCNCYTSVIIAEELIFTGAQTDIYFMHIIRLPYMLSLWNQK